MYKPADSDVLQTRKRTNRSSRKMMVFISPEDVLKRLGPSRVIDRSAGNRCLVDR